jgi:hypothetical protein
MAMPTPPAAAGETSTLDMILSLAAMLSVLGAVATLYLIFA